MKKIVLIATLLSVLAVGFAGAQAVQFRMEGNLSIPVYWGFFSGSSLGGTYGEVTQFAFVVPEYDAYLQFNLDMLRMGIGIRLFTIILESAIVPDIFVELNLDPIVIRLGCSGGGIFLFGLITADPSFGPTIAPDLKISIKFAEIFRAGIGCTAIMNFNDMTQGVFIPYINAQLVVALPATEKKSDSN